MYVLLLMDNKIDLGKYFYDIDKLIFFNNLKNINVTSNAVLDKFKQDFILFDYTLNQKKISNNSMILEYILDSYEKYLEEILLFCSFFSIKESIKQIKNILWSKYHIIEETKIKPNIHIHLNILIKQVILSYKIDIVEFKKNTSIVIHKKVLVNIIFNLTNYKYLRIILEII